MHLKKLFAIAIDRRDNEVIKLKCSIKDWRGCQMKSRCTSAPVEPSRSDLKSIIKHSCASERVKKREPSGNSPVLELELKEQSPKVFELSACVGVVIVV